MLTFASSVYAPIFLVRVSYSSGSILSIMFLICLDTAWLLPPVVTPTTRSPRTITPGNRKLLSSLLSATFTMMPLSLQYVPILALISGRLVAATTMSAFCSMSSATLLSCTFIPFIAFISSHTFGAMTAIFAPKYSSELIFLSAALPPPTTITFLPSRSMYIGKYAISYLLRIFYKSSHILTVKAA